MIDDEAGGLREQDRADTRTHTAEAGDRADGTFGEEIARHGLHIIDPCLKPEQNDRDAGEGHGRGMRDRGK